MNNDQIERLEKLSSMLDRGLLTQEEFNEQKARLLSAEQGAPPQPQPPQKPKSPTSKSSEPETKTRYWTAGRIILALIAVPGVLILAPIFFFGGIAALDKQPSYQVKVLTVDDSCSRLGDYCVRVTCEVRNVGKGDGTPRVEMKLIPEGKTPVVSTESISVPAGTAKKVSHDFGAAKMLDSHKGACVVQR